MKNRAFSCYFIVMGLAVALLPWAGISPAGAKEKEDDLAEFKDGPVQGEAGPGQALIYVLRPSKMGYAVKSWFFVDDEAVGVNKGKSCFATAVQPGKHLFWSKSENVDALEMEVLAGNTYFFQQRVQMGFAKARTKIDVLGASEGEALLGECDKVSALTEAGRARGQQLAAEHKEDTAEDLERRAKAQEKAAAKP